MSRLPFPGCVRSSALLFALVLCMSLPSVVSANGGTVQVSNRVSGAYQLSVFTSPSPIKVGIVDVSVLVQRSGSNEVVNDAVVMVMAQNAHGQGTASTFEATREQATNKLYYAAHVELPSEGRYLIEVLVVGGSGESTASFEVEATPQTWQDRPLVLGALVVLPVVALLGWIALRRRSSPQGLQDGGGKIE